MDKIKRLWAHKIVKILVWAFLILVGLYLILVAVRVVHFFNLDKTNAAVEKIHNTKLTLDDVMGKNLPPVPVNPDATVPGVDVNQNGIRDDVELAIFKEYPYSAKTRAVLLQYALALQMEVVQPIVNTTTATEVIREEDRAGSCIADILVPRKSSESTRSSADMAKIDHYNKFIEGLQINTKERDQAQASFYENLRSYNSLEIICDIDVGKLPN